MSLLLRIKLKTLAFQSAEMRYEENRATYRAARGEPGAGEAREFLHNQRTDGLRRESRSANLAYGFLLGRSYWQMERTCHERPDFTRVAELAAQFGADYATFVRWAREAQEYLRAVPPMSTVAKPVPQQAQIAPPSYEVIEVDIPNGDIRQALVSAIMASLLAGGAHA